MFAPFNLKIGDRVLSYTNVPGYVISVHPSKDPDYHYIFIKWENGKISMQPEYMLDRITRLDYF